MQEAKIKFDHVTKVFETRSQTITAVKDYSMEIQAGEFISILGLSLIHISLCKGIYFTKYNPEAAAAVSCDQWPNIDVTWETAVAVQEGLSLIHI